MPPDSSQTNFRELDMNGAERRGRPSNVPRRVRADPRINREGMLKTVASVYDRRTNPFRGTRSPHRARRKETSDGRRLRAGLLMVRPINFASLRFTQHAQSYPANLSSLIDSIAGIPFPCSGAVSASHDTATVTDRRYNAKDILGQRRPINHPISTAMNHLEQILSVSA